MPANNPGTVSIAGGSSLTTNTLPKASGASTLADSRVTDDGTTVTIATNTTAHATATAGSLTVNYLNVIGNMPAPSSNSYGAVFQMTGVGSTGASQQGGVLHYMPAGYTGAGATFATYSLNATAGTSTAPFNAAGDTTLMGNWGSFGEGIVSTAGTVGGVYGLGANTGTGPCIGVFGNGNANSGTSIGVVGVSTNGSGFRVGGYFGYNTTTPTLVGAALLVDNVAVANPIIVARDNGAALPTSGATATWQLMDGAKPQVGLCVLTSGTMTAENQALDMGSMIHSFTWTNAQVAALPASAGDIAVCTLPAKTVVKNAYVVITGQAAGPTTVTVAVGRVSATYIDYIVASDAKAAANTVYGDASGERGTNLTGYDLPSYTGTTAVNAHFVSTGGTLSTVTGSTGRVILETALVP